jgi:plastocyanin
MRRALTALLLATALVAGCGGDDEEEPASTPETPQEAPATDEGGGGGEAVKVSSPADGALKFDQAELSAKAGKVTFTYDNPSQVPHAFEVEGNGVEEETDTITESDASVTVDLKPGTYEYYCPVDGHKAAGMKGTLTVK